MTTRCDECRKPVRGGGNKTMLRTLCDTCYERSTGAAAALIAGGDVGDAISTAGWFSRLRSRRRDTP